MSPLHRLVFRFSVSLLPLAAFAEACGSDDVVAPAPAIVPTNDPMPLDSSMPVDTERDATTDSSADRREASTPVNTTTLTLVNAITDLGSASPLSTVNGGTVRLCFGITNVVYIGKPLPETNVGSVASVAGVPIGLAGSISPNEDLSPYRLTPYLMNAERLAARLGDAGAAQSCDALLRNRDAGGLVENVDFWRFQDLLQGQIAASSSILLLATGCAGDSTLSATACGAGFTSGGTGLGTLNLRLFVLSRTTNASKVGAQVIHASPSLVTDTVQPVFLDGPSDTVIPIASAPIVYPQVSIADPVFASVSASSRFAYRSTGDASAVLQTPLSAIAIQSAIPAFTVGSTFTFVVLGLSTGATAPTATRGLHYVAVNNADAVSRDQ